MKCVTYRQAVINSDFRWIFMGVNWISEGANVPYMYFVIEFVKRLIISHNVDINEVGSGRLS